MTDRETVIRFQEETSRFWQFVQFIANAWGYVFVVGGVACGVALVLTQICLWLGWFTPNWWMR